MKKKYKEILIEQSLQRKMKQADCLNLNMTDEFFEQLHDKIMSSVEKTEIKPLSRWAKTWVFLEKTTRPQQRVIKKAIRLSTSTTSVLLGIGLIGLSARLYSGIFKSF